MTKRLCVYAFALALAAGEAAGEEFVFKHRVGDKFKTISTSLEEVSVNGEFLYGTRILNRMSSEVIDIKDGKAAHKARFQLAEERERGQAEGFQWTGEYDSVFMRDGSGKITIDGRYVMPTVRNVPVFPDRPVNKGDSWEAEGSEAHDLGPSFGIKRLYVLPFTARYTFLGDAEWRGKPRKAISISYAVNDEPYKHLEDSPLDIIERGAKGGTAGGLRPLRVSGESEQIVYWDSELGQPVGAEERFRLKFELSDGNIYEFSGRAEAEIIESEVMDKESIAEGILQELSDEGFGDAEVEVVEEGVKINLENIMFEPDTAILLAGEEKKLEKIGEILLRYPDRDIMVAGHTARSGGTENSRQKLSQERASAIAAYLVGRGIRSPDRVVARGYGSQNPAASNDTEEGRQKNRRVEIIILEN
ncbi:MAG: OmpA family protein [Spirochaetaceae bacterium]|nr:OmpA family protein [Spirochaetaceae bacterium]